MCRIIYQRNKWLGKSIYESMSSSGRFQEIKYKFRRITKSTDPQNTLSSSSKLQSSSTTSVVTSSYAKRAPVQDTVENSSTRQEQIAKDTTSTAASKTVQNS